MVRLRGVVLYNRFQWFRSFQFHYGAIKGDVLLVQQPVVVWFQFHYGAIKGN